jgi:flagellar biosynthesis chaperone FliJ
MAISTPEIISGAALVVSIGVATWQRFGVILGLQKQIGDLKSSTVTQITAQIATVTAQLSNLTSQVSSLTTQVSSLVAQVGSLTAQVGSLVMQVATLDSRLSKQEAKVDLFWGAVQEAVKNMIKQPIHLRKDDLLDRFPDMSYDEICELKDILIAEKKEMIINIKSLGGDRKAYLLALALMLARVDSVLLDGEKKC